MENQIKPMVVCFSGLDPTGGAGIQADIETLAALDCHALPIISSLTVQTTSNVLATHPVDADLIRQQFYALLESGLEISAIKLGLIDSIQTLRCIAEITKQHNNIPLIADPVLKAGGGYEFGNQKLMEEYVQLILPNCLALTPNTHELNRLSPLSDTEEEALADLCNRGCKHVLLTGTHRNSLDVSNRLYSSKHPPCDKTWSWPRLDHEYHGSGCTLASALAAGLAHGLDIATAAFNAQKFTWNALNRALPRQFGQSFPDRRHSPLMNQPSQAEPLLE
jgi:hydroxymethylpyrimidine/phosphomethylpyrimidine kinase